MYMTVAHMLPWEMLKYSETVMQHLSKQSVYAYVDEFNMKKTSSPGFIGKIYPKLINLKSLKSTLEEGMSKANCDKERAVSE
eukprot:4423681-Ditylum_brightwellii.AAC.1